MSVTWRASVAAVLAAGSVAACAGEGPSERRRASRPPAPLCAELRPRITGRVQSPAATELSGLVVSRAQRGVLWAHNDSGDGARLLALRRDGRALGVVAVAGAQNVDWEDIALASGGRGGDSLFVADIGDNHAVRPSIAVFRVPEPRVNGAAPRTSAPAKRLDLRYPDDAHDAETLLVDPFDGALALVIKSFGGEAAIYVADQTRREPVTLRRAGRVRLPAGEAVTAGDVSADGRTIALRTYDRALVWSRRRGESIPEALRRAPCSARTSLAGEGLAEALALTPDGRGFFTVPEGRRPALRRYGRAR